MLSIIKKNRRRQAAFLEQRSYELMKVIVEEGEDVLGEDCPDEDQDVLADDEVEKKVEEKPTAEKHQLKLLVS